MANSAENSSNPLPITGLVSLLLAVLAVVVPPLIPLESSRPLGNNAKFLYQDIEDVNARLWQDPFAAADQHDPDKETTPFPKNCDELGDNNSSKLHHDIYALACSINIHALPDDSAVIIGVMVHGGPYAESAEQRRRIRYAVLSGLAVSGYAPEDSEHIGYFKTAMGFHLPDRIPFEWFKKIEKSEVNKPSVLLMWLDETAFSKEPVKTAKGLKEYVNKALLHIGGSNSHYLFIGPNTSDTLKAMVKEATPAPSEKNGQETSNSSKEFEFYIADATADENVLKTSGKKLNVKLFDDKTLPRVLRTTLSDQALAEKIAEELNLRGIDPVCHDSNIRHCNQLAMDNIVLISEWDTLYGREGLPSAMLKKMVCDYDNCDPLDSNLVITNWVHQFSYMRGLDGIVPDEANKVTQETKLNKATEKDKTLKDAIERPEGQNQKDYLRRMAERIEKLNQELGEKGKGEIRAIGVLGSDAYDKLLVLKALRPKFPKVIFFTTDLDTRLMHPEDIDATKNLLVASSFGLQLRHELQKNIPPFRDSRQTAFFLATQVALGNKEERTAFDQEKIDKFLKPRIFEIGLHSAVDLSPTEKNDCDASSASCCKTLETCPNIYPQPEHYWYGWKPIVLAGFIVVLALTFASYLSDGFKQKLKNLFAFDQNSSQGNQESQDYPSEANVHAILLKIFLGLALLVIGITVSEILFEDKGEPFAWANGVSLWPSEIIRLFAGVLGCFFIAKSINKLRDHKAELEKDFSLSDISPEVSENKVLVIEEWTNYYNNIGRTKFVPLVIKTTLILAGFSVLLSYAFGFPHVPYRGSVSWIANFLALLFVISVLLTLVMIAVHVTRHCVVLIEAIAQKTSQWPQKSLSKFGVAQPAGSDRSGNEQSAQLLDQLYVKLEQQGIEYHLQDSIDIEFIAKLTQSVGNLAYYPFIVLTLMGISRSRIFDNWDMPIGLLLVYILCIGLILGSKLYLRYKSEEARDKVVKQFESMLLALGSISEEDARTLEKQIGQAISRIKALKQGAYIPITQEPAMQALLLPLGGWGGVTLLQYFFMLGAN